MNSQAFTDDGTGAVFFKGCRTSAKAAPFMGHEGEYLFALKIKGLELSKDGHGIGPPPAGSGDDDIVISIDRLELLCKLRKDLVSQFLFGFFRALRIVFRIGLSGPHFKDIGTDSLLNIFGSDFRISLGQVFNAAIDVILTAE